MGPFRARPKRSDYTGSDVVGDSENKIDTQQIKFKRSKYVLSDLISVKSPSRDAILCIYVSYGEAGK